MSKSNYIWYAGYGSNLSQQRFYCYVLRGRPVYGKLEAQPQTGCNDKSTPLDNRPFLIKHKLYFALPRPNTKTPRWGVGGVAFIDVYSSSETYGRIWKITEEQFDEIWEQEGKDGWYSLKVDLGVFTDGLPIFTITHKNLIQDLFAPSDPYLKTIICGLRELNLNDGEIIKYLSVQEGIKGKIDVEHLRTVINQV